MDQVVHTFGNDKAVFVDPGHTTGVLVVDSTSKHPLILMSLSYYEFYSFLLGLHPNYKTMFVVEDFRLYSGKARALGWDKAVPARIIGGVELVCQKNGWECNIPTPIQKQIVKNLDKTSLGMKQKPANEHERDAVRLYKFWMLKHGLVNDKA